MSQGELRDTILALIHLKLNKLGVLHFGTAYEELADEIIEAVKAAKP